MPAGTVVGGVPAKVIGKYDDVKKRHYEFSKVFEDMKEKRTVENMLKIKNVKFNIDGE